ncbi:MAG: hypothetical protein HC915_15095 [Anaerolineae bacterium]|nr:hypothetical protein [Anaerolineae bacterium]
MQVDRYLNISTGTMMVVSDLHGDGEVFERVVETFLALRDVGEADRLLLLGDLIHGYGAATEDQSLAMVQRVMALQSKLGKDEIIMLLGNHEMPHIYGVSLAKGDLEFTPRFEHSLGSHREEVIAWFKSLPFALRTTAGVLFTHAGPDEASVNRAGRLRRFDHEELLRDADQSLAQQPDIGQVYDTYAQISGNSYAALARQYLAVEGPDDPRYPHLMRALFISERDARFSVLWDFLFTQNERSLTPSAYEQICQRYLDALSVGMITPQRVAVSGHIQVNKGGYEVVNERHFRLASATHARPREEGRYLLLDCKTPIRSAQELVPLVRRVF